MTEPSPAAIPAATLIVLRDTGSEPPEILMVERAGTLAFAAGMLVFPGGRVDDGDRRLAAALPGDLDETAARVAAIRETVEEAGLAVGLSPCPDAATIAALRGDLRAGVAMAEALTRHGLTLDPAALTPFARWRPTHRTSRIFDTRFYCCRAPADAPPVGADGAESVRAFWASAGDTLAAVAAGTARVIFPTRRNLERLALADTVEAALADARAHRIETVAPWIERRGGDEWLCIPDGLGYPVTAEPLATAMRG